jgi:hypothetical protein
MKKLLYIIGFITLIGCAESEYVLEDVEEIENINQFERCYNIVSVRSNNPQCDNSLSIKVVTNKVFKSGRQPTPSQKTLICITNSDYTINSFRLQQLICDLSIYE